MLLLMNFTNDVIKQPNHLIFPVSLNELCVSHMIQVIMPPVHGRSSKQCLLHTVYGSLDFGTGCASRFKHKWPNTQ